MIWFILLVIIIIGVLAIYSIANEKDSSYNSHPQSTVVTPKAKTYWETFKENNPTKAREIESVLGLNFSTFSDKDAREKIGTLERLSKGMNCPISQIKENYLKEIKKYPARLIPQMIESTSRGMDTEAETFHIKPENTATALMVKWLRERHKELGSPDANISASATKKEMEIAKTYFPDIDDEDIKERVKSLREMSELFKCSIDGLEKFYRDDVMSKYDGNFENFHYLLETFRYIANQAYEIAPRVALKPENTSYGILCDWLLDIMKEERQKFLKSGQAKCPHCHSTNVKLLVFDSEFECNSCKRRFGGL